MTMEQILSAIGTVGFPIVAFIMAGWYIIQKDKAHTNEIEKLTSSINNTNTMIHELISKIDTLLKLRKDDNNEER